MCVPEELCPVLVELWADGDCRPPSSPSKSAAMRFKTSDSELSRSCIVMRVFLDMFIP